jgi:hypothetical protein
MFHRLQVIVNDLKALGEKINDDDISHWFLVCLPLRHEMLRMLIIRGGLKELTPNQVLGDVMTQETYRVERKGIDKDEKKEDEEKKKKSVLFKASTSSKSKGKARKEESNCDEEASDFDDESMALFVRKMGKFIKKGYGARKRRDHNKEYVRRCYKCKGIDHVVADCPYNCDNDDDEKKEKKKKKKKEKKKEKKEKEKKMTFTKKRSGYVVTWDSDGTSNDDDDDSSDDDKKIIKKALESIAINNKPSLFDTTSTCLIAKPTKVKYDESDDECESDDCRSDDDEEESKEELIDMLEQTHHVLR